MLHLTNSPGENWIPIAIFSLIVSILTIFIGRPIFKRKPIWVFSVPVVLLVVAGAMIGLSQIADTFGDAFTLLFFGFLILFAGAGALVGALILFFFIFKGATKKRDPDDIFS
ncbi:MAG TPA: hypothetical protein PK340_04405 [Bacilli bacterium]|nr:hypothetical protein [Bacilli bacterium]